MEQYKVKNQATEAKKKSSGQNAWWSALWIAGYFRVLLKYLK